MAAEISSRVVAYTHPIFSINLFNDIPLICKASTTESWVNPLAPSGFIGTNHNLPANESFHFVMGAISLIDNTPMASELITIADLPPENRTT